MHQWVYIVASYFLSTALPRLGIYTAIVDVYTDTQGGKTDHPGYAYGANTDIKEGHAVPTGYFNGPYTEV